MASAFSQRNSGLAQRAVFRIIGRDCQIQEREHFFLWNSKVCLAAGAVDQKADAYDISACLIDYIHDFFDGAAGGDVYKRQLL